MNGLENLDPPTNRPYLPELNVPLGCAILNKCDICNHYCRYFRYNFNMPSCGCICGGTCQDCMKCDKCNTARNRTFAKYRKLRYMWKQPPQLLQEIRNMKVESLFSGSGFDGIWPRDGLIMGKIRYYISRDSN
jgi:hypothetical protein